MSSEFIAMFFGGLVSILFKVIPALDNWFYTKLNKDWRGLVMLGISLTVPFIILGLGCLNFIDGIVCSTSSILPALKAWGYFVVGNIGIFMMTPESKQSKARTLVTKEEVEK